MKVEERLALLKQLESVAALAGLKGVISDDGQFFLMGFEVGDGRSQRVFVRPTGSTPDGKTVVSGAADETLRFWKVFGDDGAAVNKGKAESFKSLSLTRASCIR